MPAYVVANYDITNPQAYESYPPAAIGTLMSHGAEVLVADFASEAVEGRPRSVTVVLKFESKDAARAWYESDEYATIKSLRTDNTEGVITLSDGFVMPG